MRQLRNKVSNETTTLEVVVFELESGKAELHLTHVACKLLW